MKKQLIRLLATITEWDPSLQTGKNKDIQRWVHCLANLHYCWIDLCRVQPWGSGIQVLSPSKPTWHTAGEGSGSPDVLHSTECGLYVAVNLQLHPLSVTH